jgi:hypothetical protein
MFDAISPIQGDEVGDALEFLTAKFIEAWYYADGNPTIFTRYVAEVRNSLDLHGPLTPAELTRLAERIESDLDAVDLLGRN